VTAEVVSVANSFAYVIKSPLIFYRGTACMSFTPLVTCNGRDTPWSVCPVVQTSWGKDCWSVCELMSHGED